MPNVDHWESPLRDAAILPNSSGPGPMSLCRHNISKNPSNDLTFLPLKIIVKISLTRSTGEPRHDHRCEAVH